MFTKAKDFFRIYLGNNRKAAETIEKLKSVIGEFKARSPRILVTKCIDGRVHGSTAKGYPPTTIQFGRTDGNIVSLDRGNFLFWNRIDRTVNDARCNTPEMPAVFWAYMHRSDCGLGCAAHNNDDSKAMEAVRVQVEAVRSNYKKEELFTAIGVTNTDRMSEMLLFENGRSMDTDHYVQEFEIQKTEDLFESKFLENQIDDPSTSRHLHFKNPGELLLDRHGMLFQNLEAFVSMEAYFLKFISSCLRSYDNTLHLIIKKPIAERIISDLYACNIPLPLHGALFYQTFWNILFSTHKKMMIASRTPEDAEKLIGHSEELVCYGDGFEIQPRNTAILVKTGRGNDVESLRVAFNVLKSNRERHPQDHPPLLHINLEVSGEMIVWNDFNDSVSSKIETMIKNADQVFGDNVCILTTYSYRDQKLFYPACISSDPRFVIEFNVLDKINSENEFSSILLKMQEATYRRHFLNL